MSTTVTTVAQNNNNNNHRQQQSLIGERGILLGLLRRILKRDSVHITNDDPTLKVIYLGNVVTTWAKTEGCLERPASALWRNHTGGRGSIKMTVTVTPTGLKAQTAEHGLTEYWVNRLTWTGVPVDYPKLFCWIYRHEGRKLKQELRCHAVLCPTHEKALGLATSLRNRLAEAIFDYRREKLLRQNARLSIVQSLYPNNHYCGISHSQNYKPPLDKARSAPKLTAIEEYEEPPQVVQELSYIPVEELPATTITTTSSLNLPSLNCHSKVILHLLDVPQMNSSSTDHEYPGSSNSDPVNDSSDSDSQHEEFTVEEEPELHDDDDDDEIDDNDNVSDESGYSEDTNEPVLVGGDNINNNNNNNSNHPSSNNNKTKPSSSLVLFDNLSFQI